MSDPRISVLAVGATGSIGRHVVEDALRRGHRVRALVRNPAEHRFPDGVEVAAGDLTRPNTLLAAVDGIDAIVFTHGSHGWTAAAAEAVDYGGVRNVLAALEHRKTRIALMTAIGVTDRKGTHDWKRRAERLVRASGLPYTIVRPGWFDYNEPDQRRLVFLQGDKRQSGTPRDGVIARGQLAEVLVRSLTSPAAVGKTFEFVSEKGPQQADLDRLFADLDPDRPSTVDAVSDAANMPLDREPRRVLDDLKAVELRHASLDGVQSR
ncbi:SDR family oxidoreductase [Rhodoplanes sp. SY1]|uniref:SDR family oxidoreductase n=1 Tax=Rhodoplanes sp. SY1 TaxID=3166646 RepID=UPI0038B5BC4C